MKASHKAVAGALAAVGLLAVTGCGAPDFAAVSDTSVTVDAVPAPAEESEEPAPAAPAPAPAEPAPATDTRTVARAIDGDTVELSNGQAVRLIGIDTPERGECGFWEATDRVESLVAGKAVVLQTGAQDDTDKYDRLLRYVVVDGTDVGEVLLREGLAKPRYNSTDGYGWHTKESLYDSAARPSSVSCSQPAPQEPAPAPGSGGAEPWNQPGPDLDCSDIGKKVQITGPDYHRLDRDGDGWACESYG